MTARVFEIPLSARSETFGVVLLNVTYQFTVTWRAAVSTWFLDIADANGVPLVQGIAMVTGADLLGQYRYLGIGGSLVVSTDGAPDAMPTYENLGTSSHLRFVVSS